MIPPQEFAFYTFRRLHDRRGFQVEPPESRYPGGIFLKELFLHEFFIRAELFFHEFAIRGANYFFNALIRGALFLN